VAIRIVAVREQMRSRGALAGGADREADFVQDAGHRLVRDRRLAFAQRRDIDAAVLVIRCDVHDPLDVRFLVEHLAVVLVGPDAGRRPVVFPIVRLHDLLRDISAAADARVPLTPRRIFEELADPVAIAELTPVHVVLRIPVRIDDGDELEVGTGDHSGVDLALRLSAASHLREENHVARRHVTRSPEHAARHDGEGRRGGHAAQEIAPIQIAHGCLRDRVYGGMLPEGRAKRNGELRRLCQTRIQRPPPSGLRAFVSPW
jgi:hypothetical protein